MSWALAIAGAAYLAVQQKIDNTVFLVYTSPDGYRPSHIFNLAKAIKQEHGIELLFWQVTPKRRMDTKEDYKKWQKELGLQKYNTIFVAPADYDLFNPDQYDAYMYPAEKVGFMEQQFGNDPYLVCHEALHMQRYVKYGGNFKQWSTKVHAVTNANPPKQKIVMVDVGGGNRQGFNIVPRIV